MEDSEKVPLCSISEELASMEEFLRKTSGSGADFLEKAGELAEAQLSRLDEEEKSRQLLQEAPKPPKESAEDAKESSESIKESPEQEADSGENLAEDFKALNKEIAENEPIVHEVGYSDTLDGLCIKYGVSRDIIRWANAFSGEEIYQFKQLLIPRSKGAMYWKEDLDYDALRKRT